jgi:hypothetical protein
MISNVRVPRSSSNHMSLVWKILLTAMVVVATGMMVASALIVR